jgi:predicted  nucleic acid-binding Zn-ribbon protein
MAGTKSKAKATAWTNALNETDETGYKASHATKNGDSTKRLPARTSRSQVNYKDESESEAESDGETVDKTDDLTNPFNAGNAVEPVEAAVMEKKPIFTVFNADETLEEGLCVIRSLGGGMYELVNLKNAPRFDIATEETGEIIKTVPERRGMLDIPAEQWEAARVKAELAVRSAGKPPSSFS